MKKYRHKKTGKLYSLVQEKFLIKENGEWRNTFVLYKAEYDNPDGPYFSRTIEDFQNNFEEVKEQIEEECYKCPQLELCFPHLKKKQEEEKKKECIYSKDDYTDEDRAVFCEDCLIEDCKFNPTNKK